MTLSLGIALYLMIWWMTLFAVLPFGVKTQGEAGDVVEGTPASAPIAPRLLRVVVINTFVAAIAFAFVWFALDRDWMGLYIPPENAPPAAVTP
jgi:predicted secreted protein